MRKFANLLRWGYFVLSEIIGFGGYPDDAKTWGRWLAMLEPILDIPVVRVLLIVSGGIVLTYPQWLPRIRSLWVKQDPVLPDMPIRDAIHHLVSTVPHSFDRSSYAERAMFKQIHQCMCNGDILARGATSEGGTLQKIPPKKCRELSPQEVVVPRVPATPEGIRFSLFDAKSQVEYSNLWVDSRDIYKFWPKIKKGGEE